VGTFWLARYLLTFSLSVAQALPHQVSLADVRLKGSESATDAEHEVAFFAGSLHTSKHLPPRDFLKTCPVSVRAKFYARVEAVAKAPPKRFSGGGYWEAMREDMAGWFDLRVDGPNRAHYRFFCRIDTDAKGFEKPLLVIIVAMVKPFRTTFSQQDYSSMRSIGDEYFSENPRRLV
jgi:hypothetical protein